MAALPEAEGQDRKYKRQALQLSWAGAAEDRCLLLGLELHGDHYNAEDLEELPELPAARDSEELLGLPLAVYLGEREDDPKPQVHLKGNVDSILGTLDYCLVVSLPEFSVRRFTRSQLPLAAVHRSMPMGLQKEVAWPAPLPAAPIGVGRRTAATGSCDRPNLWTLQISKLSRPTSGFR
ncbi:hypothetical protein UY3_02141 [Chelonia mydas]|uniref:Uncharacterized protein n=1 Tax=Chelonia mydas TaxID=8469 RepID=M7BTU1_CHEMY|nr:hypothetical protein UY3_02141 [Chelonia mydas]